MSSKELFDELSSCKRCGREKYGDTPFFFPIKKQKVILLTACPTIQAMFRPLTSVRFFRTLCIALFGDANISPEYIKVFHDRIYWTHYRKCYYERAFNGCGFEILNDTCFNLYFERELKILKPELIIVLGRPLAKRLLIKELINVGCSSDLHELSDQCIKFPKWESQVLVTDFPETGLEERFDLIRDTLSRRPGFQFIKRTENGRWNSKLITHPNPRQGKLKVHIDFEITALERYLEKKNKYHGTDEGSTADDIETVWFDRVIIPNRINCAQVAEVEFFIEDETKTLLLDVMSYEKNWRILRKFREDAIYSYKHTDQKEVYEYIKDHWTKAFRDFFEYQIRDLRGRFTLRDGSIMNIETVKAVEAKLRALKKIRNAIVHNGGYINPSECWETRHELFDGIYRFVNFIYIEDTGVKVVKEFAKDIVHLIGEYDKYR